MPSSSDPRSERTRVRRIPGRGVYDAEFIHAILDEALYCHVGIVQDGQPFVLPTIHVRVGDEVFLHGSKGSRLLRQLANGEEACITATLLDGLVLARSAFHHSMNYRSVVLLGRGRLVEDRAEKERVLEALVEHVVAGRAAEARMPTETELDATAVVGFPIDEVSAKARTGPPVDDEADYSLPVWAGVLPLELLPGPPIPAEELPTEIPLPAYVAKYSRARR